MFRLALASSLLAVLLVACASPGVQYAATNPVPGRAGPRPEQTTAILFTPPACSYVEIGWIETTAPVLRRDWTIPEKLAVMRRQAAAHGADALLVLGHDDTAGDPHHSASVTSHNYSGVAIAFTDDACRSPCESGCDAARP